MDGSNSTLDLVPSRSSVYQWNAGTTARDVAAVLFRRQRVILALFFGIGAGTALSVSWLAPYLNPPRFVSGLKFIIKKERFDAVVTPSDRAVPGLTTSVSPQEVYAEIELLKSSDVLERLAEAIRPSGHAQISEAERDRLVERLSQDLIAEPVNAGRNLTNLIAVRYSAADPDEVLRVLRKLPELYLEKHLRMGQRPAALDYFRAQAEAFEQQLRDCEQEMAEFEKQQLPAAKENRRQQLRQRLFDVERQRSETDTAIHEAESRASELNRQLDGLPATVTAASRPPEPSSHLDRLKLQLLELENRRAQATFYREIEQLERRTEEVRRTVAAESEVTGKRSATATANPLRAPIEGDVLRNQALLAGLRARRATLLEQERSAREQSAVSARLAADDAAHLAILTRNVKIAEENFLLYRKKYAEAREAEALDQKRILNVALVEGPRGPVAVKQRRSWFYLAVGFVVAAVVSMAAGFAAESLDHSIHTPRELENCSSLAVLACLPDPRRA